MFADRYDSRWAWLGEHLLTPLNKALIFEGDAMAWLFAQLNQTQPVVTTDPFLSWVVTVAQLGGNVAFVLLVIYFVIRVWPELRKESINEKKEEREARHAMANGFQKAITESTIGFNNTIISVIEKHDKGLERHEARADVRLDKVISSWDKHMDHLSTQIESAMCKMSDKHNHGEA